MFIGPVSLGVLDIRLVLQPSKFDGLEYEILGWKIPGVVAVIKTRDLWVVGIYVAAGTGAVIE